MRTAARQRLVFDFFDLRNRFSQIFLFRAEAQRDRNVAQTSRLRPIDSQAGGWRCFFERHLEEN
ncbi:MAG: hypothetical protein DMG85_19470 [Acidobacteria bacterium]|nr:MAG: hypothetical protein DMG85_19470 [Acidobacteriota bacterium]